MTKIYFKNSLFVCLSAFVCFAPTQATAEPRTIGAAASVENRVVGTISGATRDIVVDSEVFSNEAVRTQASSMARLRFLDDTNLAIGPSSTVTLDKYVFDPDASAASVVLNTARGGFRFVTGRSDPRAFKINTPVATIGIRGTVLDIKNSGGTSIVVLKRGALHVCVKGSNSKCADLTEANQFVVVTGSGISKPDDGGAGQFDFRHYCSVEGLRSWNACELGGSFAGESTVPSGHSNNDNPASPVKTCTGRTC